MKTIYKLYDLKFVSCTQEEFDNLLTSEIRDDCAYIIVNDLGAVNIHLNSTDERFKEIVDLINTKQNDLKLRQTSAIEDTYSFISVDPNKSKATTLRILPASKNGQSSNSYVELSDVAAVLSYVGSSISMGANSTITLQGANPGTPARIKNLLAPEDDTDAANKKYVLDNRLYVTTF